MMSKDKSYVHFKNGLIDSASNDGMEILGYFLISQVGADTPFFTKWLKDGRDNSISSSSYFVEKKGNEVYVSNLNEEKFVPFQTTRKKMIDIMHEWSRLCSKDTNSVCGLRGISIVITRSDDGTEFEFTRE